MSYTVYYGGDRPKHERRKESYRHICAILLVVCVIVTGLLFPQQSQRFLQALFPWLNSDTRTAFAVFAEDLKEGKSGSGALKDFCVEIIHYACQPD